MVHRVVWRVGSEDALGFWEEHLAAEGASPQRTPGGRLRFRDPEGLEHELRVDDSGDEPLTADHPEVAAEAALRGFDAVRAYAADPEASRGLLEDVLGFRPAGDGWEVRGDSRGGLFAYDAPPEEPGVPGAGTIHHVAFATQPDEQEAWRERVADSGAARPTPVIDRFYFRSVYFREPSGVLFELATLGPGFTADEPLESLGEKLSLPPAYEHLREQIEAIVTPLPNPRAPSRG
jgi:glyoxalase family protein